jgi:hypothetical protein
VSLLQITVPRERKKGTEQGIGFASSEVLCLFISSQDGQVPGFKKRSFLL